MHVMTETVPILKNIFEIKCKFNYIGIGRYYIGSIFHQTDTSMRKTN